MIKLPVKRFAFKVYDADDNIIADCGLGSDDKEVMIERANIITEAINGLADTRNINHHVLREISALRALAEIHHAVKNYRDCREAFLNNQDDWDLGEQLQEADDHLARLVAEQSQIFNHSSYWEGIAADCAQPTTDKSLDS